MLYSYGWPFDVGLPLLLLALLIFSVCFSCLCSSLDVYPVVLYSIFVYFCYPFFGSIRTYWVPAKIEHILIIDVDFPGCCLLFVVLVVPPLLQHAVLLLDLHAHKSCAALLLL